MPTPLRFVAYTFNTGRKAKGKDGDTRQDGTDSLPEERRRLGYISTKMKGNVKMIEVAMYR